MEESQSLEELRKQIIGIIDMDRFLIHKKILFKELGILKAGDVSAKSYFFDFGMCLSDLGEKGRRNSMRHNFPLLCFSNFTALKEIPPG
jgi:hypothetical protein